MSEKSEKVKPAAPAKVPSAWGIMWGEIKSDKVALVSLFFFIIVMAGVFIWASQLDPREVLRLNLRSRNMPPGDEFLLGTDIAGRNMLPLMVIGARNSFTIALAVAVSSSLIGLILGLISGFYGGHTDNIIMRIVDFFTVVPTLMVIIVLVSITERTVANFTLIMIIFSWIGMTRQIRMITLSQGSMEYVKASKTLGTRNPIIIIREVIPNIVSFMMMTLILNIAGAMGIETGLTFLGFGLPFGTPTLGFVLTNARDPHTMMYRPWQWLPAALLILLMMLCINYVGQALNRAADARRRRV